MTDNGESGAGYSTTLSKALLAVQIVKKLDDKKVFALPRWNLPFHVDHDEFLFHRRKDVEAVLDANDKHEARPSEVRSDAF
jgi:hypothetical protein